MAASREGAKWMLMAVVFFSIAHASVKFLGQIPFYQLVFLRQLTAMLICAVMMARVCVKPFGNNKPMLLARGLSGTMALCAYFYTLHHMPLASAVTLQYLSPIMTVALAHFLFNEKAPKDGLLAFVVAFAGVVMVKGFDPRISLFDLMMSGVAVCGSALAYNFVRALKNTDHELVVVFYFSLISIPIVTPFAINTWVWPVGWEWLIVLLVGGSTFCAQYFMTKAFQRDTAANVAIFNYVGIIFALTIGYFIFDETFSLMSFVGMFVVLFGVYLGTLKRKRRA